MNIPDTTQEHKPNLSDAERMFRLFTGNPAGHGTYVAETSVPTRAGQKVEIKNTAQTIKTAPTADLWHQHLDGTRPLGIVPVMPDGTCHWAAIDIDKYDLTHADIVKALADRDIPGIVCRSKSGGAHILFFFSEPVPAATVMTKLVGVAVGLGWPADTEVFPKQSDPNVGNWLNMPYFDADKGTRYAVREDGRGLSLYQFLKTAEAGRITKEQFEALSAAEVLLPVHRDVRNVSQRVLTDKEKAEVNARGTTAGGARVLAWAVEQIRMAVPGTRDNINNRVSFIIGQFVGGGEISHDTALDALREAVLSRADNPDNPKVQEDQSRRLTRRLAEGAKEPRQTDPEDTERWSELHRLKLLAPYIPVEEILETTGLSGDPAARQTIERSIARQIQLNRIDSDVTLPVANEYRVGSVEEALALIEGSPEGVHVVRALPGSGKTKVIAGALVVTGKELIAGFHREALAREFAEKRGVVSYKSGSAGEAAQLAVCAPSIVLPKFETIREKVDCLIIEEGAQFYDFITTNTLKAKVGTLADIFEAWVDLVRRANTVLVLDAEANDALVAWLKEIRGDVNLYRVEKPGRAGRRAEVVFARRRHAVSVTWILAMVRAGEKIWVSCETALDAETLTRKLADEGVKVMGVWQKNKLSKPQKAFLSNVEIESRNYDVVVHSPVIDSGVSVEHTGEPHFTLGVFIGSGGAITARSAYQMLGRVRYLDNFVLFIDPDNRVAEPNTLEFYLDRWEKIDGAELDDFDKRCLSTQRRQMLGRRNFAGFLLRRIEAAGFAVEVKAAEPEEEMAKAIRALRKEIREEKIERIVAAEEIDGIKADVIKNADSREEEETASLDAYWLRMRLNTRELTPDIVRLCVEKNLFTRLDYLWTALGHKTREEKNGAPGLSRWVLWEPIREAYGRVFGDMDWWRILEWQGEKIYDAFDCPPLSLEDVAELAGRIRAEKGLLMALGMIPGGHGSADTDAGLVKALFRNMGLDIERVREGNPMATVGYSITGVDRVDAAYRRRVGIRWDAHLLGAPEWLVGDLLIQMGIPEEEHEAFRRVLGSSPI